MSVALVGSGNILFNDEGIGIYAVKYIQENYDFDSGVEIIDGGTFGFGLLPILQEFDYVIIANTSSSTTKEVGEIELISDEELMRSFEMKKTANEVEIAQMLQISFMWLKQENRR